MKTPTAPLLSVALCFLLISCAQAPQPSSSSEDAAATPTGDEGASQRPEDTEVWAPEPAVVKPGVSGAPPSDAIVLFDGSDLSAWSHEDGREAEWLVSEGAMTVVAQTGGIRTRQGFGSVQLHIEWRTPGEASGEGQGRGNSGVFFMERYELQVLDSYENRTYSNGQAGSIYKQHIPQVNASRGPGVWQSYDVVFAAPGFAADGSLEKPAFMTVFHNGVLVLDHVELEGNTEYVGPGSYEAHPDRVPILLQDHGNPVSFRNVWVRELPAGA